MSEINVNDNTIIYVLSPAYTKTGGPELLHQLVFKLNRFGIKAYITYYNTNDKNSNYTNEDFKKYIDTYKVIDEIQDDEKNIIISPESVVAIKKLYKLKKIKKIIWWLSVDNFTKHFGLRNSLKSFSFKHVIKLLLNNNLIFNLKKISEVDYHLCQSNYAMDFLKKMEIPDNKIKYLSDYISKEYLKITDKDWPKKENIVLYNPKKGYEFTQKIIKFSDEQKYVPIQNLTTEEVKELLLKSKVYIDFGNHPGKDRFPREAAICGCCVITGKRGAANYYNDVPIPDEFKFNDDENNIEKIVLKIEECINNYSNEIAKLKKYREFIYSEENKFEEDILKIFLKK